MITLQTVKEEIANNLLEQLDYIIKSGDNVLLENWLFSLTEDQMNIVKEKYFNTASRYGETAARGLPVVVNLAGLGLAGYRAYQYAALGEDAAKSAYYAAVSWWRTGFNDRFQNAPL